MNSDSRLQVGNNESLVDSQARPERGNPFRAMLYLIALPLLSGLAIVVALALGLQGSRITILAIALLTLSVACIPPILDVGRAPRDRHIFISLLGLIFMAHYVLPALVFYVPAVGGVEAPALATEVYPAAAIKGQLVALAGLLGLLIGYVLPIGKGLSFVLPRPRYDWSPELALLVGVGMAAVGWGLKAAALMGLIPPWLGTGALGAFANYYFFANVLFAVVWFRDRKPIALAFLVPSVVAASLFGLFSSRKIEMLVGPAIVVLTYMLWSGKVRARWFAVAGLVVALVYPTSQFVRHELQGQYRTAELLLDPADTLRRITDFLSSDASALDRGLLATAARMDGLGVTSVIVRDTPDRSPFQDGRTLALFFVAFVPRAFWPEKPTITIGGWITTTYGPGAHIKSSTGPTQIGDLYLNFGWTSVILGMFLLGLVLRTGHEVLFRLKTPVGLLMQVILVFWLVIRFEGPVGAVYSSMIFALLPVVAIHMLLRLFFPLPLYRDPRTIADPKAIGGTGTSPAIAG